MPREVEIAGTTNTEAAVASGIQEGEEIALQPTLAAAARIFAEMRRDGYIDQAVPLIMVSSITTSLRALIPCSRYGGM